MDRIARHLAASVTCTTPAHILGTTQTSAPDLAGFANGVMVRYLDYNDSYFSPGGGHPSDMIPAVLALAEPMGADGRTVMTAIVLAYEVFCRLSDHVVIGEIGWDQSMFSVIGEDADCTHRFPDEYNYHMEVTTTSGQRFSAATAYPQGHWRKPLSDAEVEHKFRSLAGDVLSE